MSRAVDKGSVLERRWTGLVASKHNELRYGHGSCIVTRRTFNLRVNMELQLLGRFSLRVVFARALFFALRCGG